MPDPHDDVAPRPLDIRPLADRKNLVHKDDFAEVLPPVEGEDPPLDFDWGGEQTELSVAQIAGSVDELLTQAQEAELAGQIELALSCLERAAALASDDEAVRDAVASFLARHPGA